MKFVLALSSADGFGAKSEIGGEGPGADFWISQGAPHTPRKHIAFRADFTEDVELFYKAAISEGAVSNGEPGYRPRYNQHYYAAFILIPDGYNIEVVHYG